MNKNNKTVGIVTFHNGSNYGAALQSYALQYVMRELLYDVYIINYDNHFITKGLRLFRIDFSRLGLFFFWYDIVNFKKNRVKIAKFKKFFDAYYHMTDLQNAKALRESSLSFDLGVSGSDQIWNPLLNNGIDDIYFLRFGSFKNKISYGSSFGAYKFDDETVNNQVKTYLADFDRLSVRENAKPIAELLGKKVDLVCDPTLLLDRETWIKTLDIKVKERRQYLLVYALADFEEIINCARTLAKKRNISLLCIGKQFKSYRDVDYILDAGPVEFVDLFYNASYIVTNSFHGTAFSVNFNKQFISVQHRNSPERVLSLLKLLGLEKRIVRKEDFSAITLPDITETDYEMVNKKLNAFRSSSLKYLKGEND